jgi:divalent metal cation (Fe/Co/Zn/Cd) transporter
MPTMEYVGAEVSAWAVRSSSVRRLQVITIAWMSVEVFVAVLAAIRAHSVALLAFGGDSAIELLSALIVLLRFAGTRISERNASRSAAVLLYVLAAFIVAQSGVVLAGRSAQPQPSYLGIGLLVAAALIMPWLARRKRQLASQTGSSALAADAVQSSLCGWLAWIALAGLVLNSLFRISWADPVAALVLVPLIIKEGHTAWQARLCC